MYFLDQPLRPAIESRKISYHSSVLANTRTKTTMKHSAMFKAFCMKCTELHLFQNSPDNRKARYSMKCCIFDHIRKESEKASQRGMQFGGEGRA